jgi:hypothetical protein
LLVFPLAAQKVGKPLQTGNLSVTVVDPSGAVVQNAEVGFTGERKLTTTTGQDGSSHVTLPYGSYTVIVKSPGFEPAKIINLPIRVPEPPDLKVALQLGNSVPDPMFETPIPVETITSDLPNVIAPKVTLPLWSLCEALADAARFDGTRVRVHAKYSGTFEGTWLTDSQCDAAGELLLPFNRQPQVRYGVDRIVKRLSKKYGINDVIRDRAWEQFDFARSQLYRGMTPPTAGCCDDIMADFDGIIIIRRNFRVDNGFGNGWGHMGGSQFLLVLRSVSNVTPHPCAGAPSDQSPPLLKIPTNH